MEAIPRSWMPIARCLPPPLAVVEGNPTLYHVGRPPLALLAGHRIQTQ
jgi:hypothetical protein